MSRTVHTLAVASLVAGIAAPARAHTPCERIIQSAEWAIDPTTVGRLRGCLSGLNRPATVRLPSGDRPVPRTASPWVAPPRVEQWRPLVESFFSPDRVGLALRVMDCESHGDPNAYNPSGASGLYQHMAQYWADRSAVAGWAGTDIFDPTANVAVAAWLSKGGTDWSHWRASKGCWG